jgi:hypothetical protein
LHTSNARVENLESDGSGVSLVEAGEKPLRVTSLSSIDYEVDFRVARLGQLVRETPYLDDVTLTIITGPRYTRFGLER